MSAFLFEEKHPRLSFRHGKVPAEVVLGFTIGVLTFAIVLAWALQIRAGRLDMTADAVLEPIPADQVPEDGGCCGGDPQEAQGVCCVELTYNWTHPDTRVVFRFTVTDCELCTSRRAVCVVGEVWQTPNGHWGIQALCRMTTDVDMRRVI